MRPLRACAVLVWAMVGRHRLQLVGLGYGIWPQKLAPLFWGARGCPDGRPVSVSRKRGRRGRSCSHCNGFRFRDVPPELHPSESQLRIDAWPRPGHGDGNCLRSAADLGLLPAGVGPPATMQAQDAGARRGCPFHLLYDAGALLQSTKDKLWRCCCDVFGGTWFGGTWLLIRQQPPVCHTQGRGCGVASSHRARATAQAPTPQPAQSREQAEQSRTECRLRKGLYRGWPVVADATAGSSALCLRRVVRGGSNRELRRVVCKCAG